MRRTFFTLALLTGFMSGGAASGHDGAMRRAVSGPVDARLVRVIDGDTLLVDAMPWPQQSVRVYVRLRGIDAPELHARCAAARARAHEATTALSGLVGGGRRLVLRDIAGGKYFGRVLADVETAEGVSLSASMLASRLVAAYAGGRRTASSCDALAASTGS